MSASRESKLLNEGSLKLADVLEEFDERLGSRPEPEILTLTEKMGFISQRERFNKRLAIADTSNYKLIGLNDIAFNPYLLWANAIAQNRDWNMAIISPLYPTFRVRKGYNARFVNYLLCSGYLRSRYGAISYGSVPRKRRSTVKDFLDLVIPAQPSLVEQERIVTLLDEADKLRTLRAHADRRTSALIPAIFHELFGDPITNAKGWPIRRIGELLESASYGTSEKSGGTGEFPVLRMNNIKRTGVMDFSDLKFMDLDESKHARYLVRTGDVLFNRTNSADLVGKTGIFREKKPMAYAGYLIRLRVNDENDPEYLSAFLNTAYAKQILRGMCKTIIGMANINATEIQGMRIPQPPLPLQKEFANRVTEIIELEAKQTTSGARLESLFQSILHCAFIGEL